MLPKDLAAALRAERERRGLARAEVASVVAVSDRWLAKLERGAGAPAPATTEALIVALHLAGDLADRLRDRRDWPPCPPARPRSSEPPELIDVTLHLMRALGLLSGAMVTDTAANRRTLRRFHAAQEHPGRRPGGTQQHACHRRPPHRLAIVNPVEDGKLTWGGESQPLQGYW